MASGRLYNRIESDYRKSQRFFDVLYFICVISFAAISLIRDCVSELWATLIINPYGTTFVFFIDCVLLPMLAIFSLVFDFKGQGRLRLYTILVLVLLFFFQINSGLQFFQSVSAYVTAMVDSTSLERGLWIYNVGCIYRLGLGYLVVATKGRDFRKVAWAFVISQAILMVIITALALTGVIPDLVYEEAGRANRHSLGLHYPLNYVSHWFSIALIYCYLKNGLLKVWDYAGLLVLWGVSIFVCKSQTCMIMFALLIFGTLIRQIAIKYPDAKFLPVKEKREKLSGMMKKCLQFSYPALAVLMIAGSYLFFPPISTVMYKIPGLGTFFSRFTFARTGLIKYFPSIFGVDYPISTWANTVKSQNYFFIDCSYVSELLHCGVIVYPIIILALFYICRRLYKENQGYLLGLAALFAIICTMEYHLADFSFNIFWLLIFANITAVSKKGNLNKENG